MTRVWSPYQSAIFDFALNDNRNCIVEACPGSGKSTVIEEVINRIPMEESVLAVAFTTLIRDELKKRVGHLHNVTVATLNGFGNSACKSLGWYKVNKEKVANILKYDVFDLKDNYTKEKFKDFCRLVGPITRLMSILKGHMVFTVEDCARNYEQIAQEYDIELPDDIFPFLIQVFELDQKKKKVIDFDDQIAIPLRMGFTIPQFKRVLVDESQDLTPAQIELCRLALAPDGRAMFVGDRKQSIYLFRGADARAMDNVQSMLDCVQLPLSICYRCSKAVVRAAQKLFPDIEPWDQSPEGSESWITTPDFRLKAEPGDYVLCRTTAPIVQECLRFIRNGVKAIVKGREIGTDLANLVMKIAGDSAEMPIPEFINRLSEYSLSQSEKLAENEAKLIRLNDNVDTIRCLAEECSRVSDIAKRISGIFGDESSEAIMLMTIHKAKGLEAPKVFILRPDLLPHKLAKSPEAQDSEKRLEFVAITRAQVDLVWVEPEKRNDG